MPTIYDLLETIRRCPGMYLSTPALSLNHLQCVLWGYDYALYDYGLSLDPEYPRFGREFHDWVARKLNRGNTNEGWCYSILATYEDGDKAIDAFFNLLDEYRQRIPSTVHRLRITREHRTTGRVKRWHRDPDGHEYPLPSPVEFLIVRFRKQPGYFLYSSNPDGGQEYEDIFTTLQKAMEYAGEEFVITRDEWEVIREKKAMELIMTQGLQRMNPARLRGFDMQSRKF